MSAPMVLAILAGNKTQTRRVIKPRHADGVIAGPAAQPFHAIETWGGGKWNVAAHSECLCCPYGVPAALDPDKLWVRETWNAYPRDEDGECYAPYKTIPKTKPSGAVISWAANVGVEGPWRPSIFMPRWASRITLEITEVRVERLNEISEKDAEAEGAHRKIWITSPMSAGALNARGVKGSFRDGYKDIWEEINGAGSWALNPWVWSISFRRITP